MSDRTRAISIPRYIVQRLVLLPVIVVAIAEVLRLAHRLDPMRGPARDLLASAFRTHVATEYIQIRTWVLAHPKTIVGGLLGALVALFLVARTLLIVWYDQVVARLAGTRQVVQPDRFPRKKVDVIAEIRRRPKGTTFLGLSPRKATVGWRWKPAYITARQRTMHRHIVGKTGSGKTQGLIWPQVLQDAQDAKGVLVMDAKGSDDHIRMMKGIAQVTRRNEKLYVFALPAWNRPQLFTHTYNMIHIRPGSDGRPGDDPAAIAERVFPILPLGDNPYYNAQAEVLFRNLVKLLHGMVDKEGPIPFTLRDVSACVKGAGEIEGGYHDAFDHCLNESTNREAAREVKAHANRLGASANECFSGLIAALDRFDSPVVNAYDPDIVFADIVAEGGMVYVQLPANLFPLQARAMGQVMLMDVQQVGSLRQVFGGPGSDRPFAVTIDEFYNFAYPGFVDSLNKLRDACVEYTVSHQTVADLTMVSPDFADSVFDNTRSLDLLAQDSPVLCERIAKMVGTSQVEKRTVRREKGPLFTSKLTWDASSRMVEEYRLHPNKLKNLAPFGQGYLLTDEGVLPVCYGMLPDLRVDYPLPRKDQTQARGLRLHVRFVVREPTHSADPGTAQRTGSKE